MRGRPAKPLELKVLAGNPGKRSLKSAKAAQANGYAVAPKTLSKDARTIWTRVVGAMPSGVYSAADENLIAAFCEAVSMHRQASAVIAQHGLFTAGSTGQMIAHPAVKIQADQARLIHSLGSRLGLDPASRQSLHVEDSDRSPELPFGIH